ncbi:MAG TPA: phage major capsid protein [Deinococcales bacterium]|nr:phage major capsid protein [Deinococcales bacterium]
MAITKRSDLIVPEILTDAIKAEFTGMTVLNGTNAAVVNPTMPSTRGGDVVKVPYFGLLGELDDINDDETTGTADALVPGVPALTPAKLTMTADSAQVHHAGKAFEVTEWAQMAASYADPYAEAARQVRIAVQRRLDKALIDAARTTDLVTDVYNATTPVNMSYDLAVDAKYLWGDQSDGDIAMMAIHSNTGKAISKLKDSMGRPLLVDPKDGAPSRFAGMPLKQSDLLSATGSPTKYETLLVKPGALIAWYNGDFQVQTDKDILSDTRIAAVHIYYVVHRYRHLVGNPKTGVVKIVHN